MWSVYTQQAVSRTPPTARFAPLLRSLRQQNAAMAISVLQRLIVLLFNLQELAAGTQDLAALVGLFATDSVERYSVDFSRGYLGAAMAPESMLGILGYARALIKMAMGTEACVSAAFPTAPVRALLGVSDEDRLPGDELVTVKYIKRYVMGENIGWKTIKLVAHKKESMPLLLLEAGRNFKSLFSRQTPPRWRHAILAIIFTTGANCFAALLAGAGWSWSKCIASVVMFVFLATSSVMWAYVNVQEQVPVFSDDSNLWLNKEGEIHNRTGDVKLANVEYSDDPITGDWTCLLLDLAGDESWEKAEPVLVPMIQITYRVDKLNETGEQMGRPIVLTGFCTCLSLNDPATNFLEVANEEVPQWLPFNQLLPAPSGFLQGKVSHIRVVLETGEAGDKSIDSELTVDGYTKRWPSFRAKIEESASLQKISKRDGPQRTIVQLFKERKINDKVLRPELVKSLLTPKSTPRQPEISRIGKSGDVILQTPRGGPLNSPSVIGTRLADSAT
ncbi:hypothetical protein K458DRAFT_387140 [Lentithecium fluviatile CBS 122367]|uniref:Uncharacterized protein n=1 Tax=Lentithecium fluviatile CBS 122367 TaxID=1168545 RepID=A0A6G1J7N0_9PLEO|nr:hypothetical protein K458DRAFT_387140 [Lentithecium fluviatile CBS 122367]